VILVIADFLFFLHPRLSAVSDLFGANHRNPRNQSRQRGRDPRFGMKFSCTSFANFRRIGTELSALLTICILCRWKWAINIRKQDTLGKLAHRVMVSADQERGHCIADLATREHGRWGAHPMPRFNSQNVFQTSWTDQYTPVFSLHAHLSRSVFFTCTNVLAASVTDAASSL
jgi:hypothetical protein